MQPAPRLPRHLSVASVQRYARCPLDWKRWYVDKVRVPPPSELLFGRAFAQALEAHHRGDDGDVAWVRAHAEVGNARPGAEYGLQLLALYRDRYQLVGRPEASFSLYLPDRDAVPVPILGVIDLLCEDEVVEFKTSKATWTQQRVDAEYQAAVYGWAFRRLKKRRADRVRYIVFSTKEPAIAEFETHPDGMDLRLFEIAAAATWAGIVAERFDGCGKCQMCRPAREGPSFVVASEAAG
jgi:hypothetical protein